MKKNNILCHTQIIILILCTFFAGSYPGFSQTGRLGIPLIHNITPEEYGLESQNFSISQDAKGQLYVGNLGGILIYDGHHWTHLRFTGAPSLEYGNDGRMYAGGYNEFGYIKENSNGTFLYISLMNTITPDQREFGAIVDVIAGENAIFFFTKTKIYTWDGATTRLIDESKDFINLFKVGNDIYSYKYGVGLLRFANSSFTMVIGGDCFSERKILDVLPDNEELLVITNGQNAFYHFSKEGCFPFRTEADEFFHENEYIKGVRLSDGNYALGSRRKGIIILNNKGDILNHIHMKSGLNNDEIRDLYIDYHNDLWAATNNGISRIETPDAITYFNRNMGILGGAKEIAYNDRKLYIATTQGVRTLPFDRKGTPQNSEEWLLPVEGIVSDGNSFLKISSDLFLCADDGLYKIVDDKATKIFSGTYETVQRSLQDSSVFLAATDNGIEFLTYKDRNFVKKGKLPGVSAHIRTIAEEPGYLWMGTDYSGVFCAEAENVLTDSAKVYNYRFSQGLPEEYDWLDVYCTRNGVLFSTSNGLFRFNYRIRRFYPDTIFGLPEGKEWIFPMVEDSDGNIWFSSGAGSNFRKTTGYGTFNPSTGKYYLTTTPFQKMRNFTIEDIFISDSIVWFASFDAVIRFDQHLLNRYNPDNKVILRAVRANEDSLLSLMPVKIMNLETDTIEKDSLMPVLSFHYNSFAFNFACPSFESQENTLFSFKLKGYDNIWTKWGPVNYKEYTNLPEGNYVFMVKAKDIHGVETKISAYPFRILPPVYRTWWAYLLYFLFVVSFVYMIMKWRSFLFEKEKHTLEKVISERTEELVMQMERSEELVANILPKHTADELKSVGKASRRKYNMVTVLFSDIQGFTKIAENMNPEVLLDELDKFFFHFDMIVEKYHIEKIKTIGDTYMCAGGIPTKNRTNPIDVVMAALEMRNHMISRKKALHNDWDIRIGIHSGPVIAGVVGSKKLAYDIWGDSVNIASRMESSGEAGEINISEATYELVHPYFECKLRGKIPAKYKGDVGMYFVTGLKPEFSVDGLGLVPNQNFITKLQIIRFDDLEELIMTKLDKGLPKNLYYHTLKHSIDVLTQVELIGRNEGVSEEDMILLKTAALFHDTGFLIGFDDHELLGIKMAKEILPDYYYTPEQIDKISELIYATKLPPEPKNLLEEIMCDADLDYLGRTDFIPVSQQLFRELFEHNKIKTLEEWNKLQVKFMTSHSYFTKTARDLREDNKKKQLEKIRSMI